MAIKKNITIDGIEVPFKASAAVPRLYRLKFGRDIYKDFAALQKDVKEGDEENSTLDIDSVAVHKKHLARPFSTGISWEITGNAGMWLYFRETFEGL